MLSVGARVHLVWLELRVVTRQRPLRITYTYRFVMIRLDYYGMYGYCFYETNLVKHVPEYDVMVLCCYTVVVFRKQSFNLVCRNRGEIYC